MRSTCIFLFYSWRPKTCRKSITAVQISPDEWGMNIVFLCPNRKDWEKKLHISTGMSVFKQCSYMCYINWCWSLKKKVNSSNFAHTHLFYSYQNEQISCAIISGIWAGNDWIWWVLTAVFTHTIYLELLLTYYFFLFVWRRMKPVDEYIK